MPNQMWGELAAATTIDPIKGQGKVRIPNRMGFNWLMAAGKANWYWANVAIEVDGYLLDLSY
jgi:hypothetical protein